MKRLSLYFSPIVIICTVPMSYGFTEDELFELSLKELSSITVTGAAVRSLNLTTVPYSHNIFSHSNLAIPASIDVVDHKTIEARGLNTVVDVVASMTGVLSGESPSEPYSFSMRGFTRNSVGVLYDGVSMGMSTLNMRPQTAMNLERVEVVKGASVLNASDGSAGGTVNIITKKPTTEWDQIDVQTRFGEFNRQSYNLGFNAALDDTQAYRVDINHNRSDGWVDDTYSDSLNASFAYLLKPVTDMTASIYVSMAEDNLPAYWGTPLVPESVAQDPDNGVVSTSGDQVVDLATRFNNYNVADSVIDSQNQWVRFDLSWRMNDHTHVYARSYQFSADRLWKNAESYSYNTTSDLVERDRLYVKHKRYVRGLNLGLSYELQTQTPQKLSIEVLTSTNDFTRDIGFDLAAADFYNIDSVNLNDPIAGNFGNLDLRQDKQLIITDAIVLQHEIAFTEKWKLQSSMRSERILFDRVYVNFDNSIRERATLEKQFNQQRYFIGSSYQLAEQAFIYAHYSKQQDPIEDSLSLYYDIHNLTVSNIDQIELGSKAVFETDTEMTAALFYIEKQQGYQAGLNTEIGENHYHSQGLELALRHPLTERFRVGGSYAYTQAKYHEFYDGVSGTRLDGNQPVNVPESMFNAWLSINEVFGLPIEYGLGYQYVSSRFANAENTIKLNDYQLLNVFMAYQAQQYRVALSVRNVADEVYAPWSDVYYPNQVALGAPRTIDISLRANF